MKQRGFTIVELIVVIVVIAILATLATLAYSRMREDAIRSAVETDLKTAAQAMEQYRNFHNTYPSVSSGSDIPNYKGGPINVVYVQNTEGREDFCIEAANGPTGGVKMSYSRKEGITDKECKTNNN